MNVNKFRDPATGGASEASQLDVARAPVAAGEKITVGSVGTNRSSTAFPAGTRVVRVCATVDCFIEIGAGSPTAVADTSTYLPAGVVEYFAAVEGQKIAVIRSAVDGSLFERPFN